VTEEEYRFRAECLAQLREDLSKILAGRRRDLADIDVRRAELQEAIRKLNMDVAAVDVLLNHMG